MAASARFDSSFPVATGEQLYRQLNSHGCPTRCHDPVRCGRAAYGAERFELVAGLSNESVVRYRQRRLVAEADSFSSGARPLPRLLGPQERALCDVVFVDGAKHLEGRLADLYAFKTLSSPNAILFYDEATTLRCVKGLAPESSCPGHFGASMAYNRVAREGLVKVQACEWAPREQGAAGRRRGGPAPDGSCVAQYL